MQIGWGEIIEGQGRMGINGRASDLRAEQQMHWDMSMAGDSLNKDMGSELLSLWFYRVSPFRL